MRDRKTKGTRTERRKGKGEREKRREEEEHKWDRKRGVSRDDIQMRHTRTQKELYKSGKCNYKKGLNKLLLKSI